MNATKRKPSHKLWTLGDNKRCRLLHLFRVDEPLWWNRLCTRGCGAHGKSLHPDAQFCWEPKTSLKNIVYFRETRKDTNLMNMQIVEAVLHCLPGDRISALCSGEESKTCLHLFVRLQRTQKLEDSLEMIYE
jgi:hypothetical protein